MAIQTANASSLTADDPLTRGRQRLQQVFKYLQALHEHRNPAKRQVDEQPWRLWFDSLPRHPTIIRTTITADDTDDTPSDESQKAEAASILSVERPKLSDVPPPPAELRNWLKPGWEKPENQCDHLAQMEDLDENGTMRMVRFEEELYRLELYEEWAEKHEAWRATELPARNAMKVFESIYELHGQIEREAERYELVIGDGIVSWRLPDGGIFHPVLIRRVQLEFDAHVPRFRVVDIDKPTELYTALFSTVPDVDGQSLAQCRSELEAGDYHPLMKDANAFLKRFAIMLSPQGALVEEGRPPTEAEFPVIGRSPVLFLRSRAQSFARAIEQLLDNLEKRTDFCGGLLNIVGEEATATDRSPDTDREPIAITRLSRRDILFSKKANRQQEEIVQRLEHHGAVLVQGPPGTGKSHTIANLIGHLLAHGKSILVTSHTTKALRVLRGHVVDQLRPLCVSVLESDSESRDQLRESVQGISSRLSQSDHTQLMREADCIATERNKLYDRLEKYKTELQNALKDEYRNIVVAGKEYSPKEAAKKVAEGIGKHDWIPGPVTLGETLPIAAHEVLELYSTNNDTTPNDDAYVDIALPPLEALPKPDAFSQWLSRVNTVNTTRQSTFAQDKDYWARSQFKQSDIAKLDALKRQFQQFVETGSLFSDWEWAAVSDGRNESTRAIWKELLAKIDSAKASGVIAQHVDLKFAPELPDGIDRQTQRQLLVEICCHLQSGGRLSRFNLALRPRWRRGIHAWRVRHDRPAQLEQFQALAAILDAETARIEMSPIWDGLIGKRGGKSIAEMGAVPEQYCAQQSHKINALLDWWQINCIAPIDELKSFGFRWDVFINTQEPYPGEHGELIRIVKSIREQLIPALDFHVSRIDAAYGKLKLEDICRRLDAIDRPEVRALCDAIQARDDEAYRSGYDAIEAATKRSDVARRRQTLLSALRRSTSGGETVAGTWAEHIRLRSGVHGLAKPPGDVSAAWEWRQLNDELDRRAAVDIERLGDEIESLTSRLEEVTVELIDRRAWAGQKQRTSLKQHQSLMNWLEAVHRMGRGYTKRAPQLRRAAQEMMVDCQDAVPVWIMPLSRVADSFDFSQTSFDVVIIDEASQCDAMALIVLGIARSVVIVGDHEQVSPLAVGQDTETVEKLIAMHLPGIPGAVLYDGKRSIYDIAKSSFGDMIRLIEHFRCVPDIIQFSNHLSYHGEIQPLRDESSSLLVPHVVPFRVQAIRREEDTNSEEAIAIASLIAAAIKHPAYANQTFGAITLLGERQAFEIEKLLLKHLEPEEIEKRRILCGNPAQFQGDERGVIFLSLVDVPAETPLSIKQAELFKQRFNVAASRARNQMWVVYSLDPKKDLKEGDLRRRLIEHALDPKSIERQLERAEQRVESEFERLVARRLIEQRYVVIPQWKVGTYRIDLVVQDGTDSRKRLAIECDGDKFHPIENLANDLERQAILERLEWRFLRLRGSEFFRNPDATMKRVFDKLNAMEIRPTESGSAGTDNSESTRSYITDALIRRASEIRDQWQKEEPADPARLF